MPFSPLVDFLTNVGIASSTSLVATRAILKARFSTDEIKRPSSPGLSSRGYRVSSPVEALTTKGIGLLLGLYLRACLSTGRRCSSDVDRGQRLLAYPSTGGSVLARAIFSFTFAPVRTNPRGSESLFLKMARTPSSLTSTFHAPWLCGAGAETTTG